MRRFLTDEEIQSVKQVRQAVWPFPILATIGCFGAGLASLTGNALALVFLAAFGLAAVVLWPLAIRKNRQLTADIEERAVEVLEGAPERVWMTSRNGPCYLWLSGQKIRIPIDDYESVKGAYIVKVAFLPRSRIAVRVEAGRGITL